MPTISTKFILKNSSIIGKVPLESDLTYGEVALNYADGRLYYKNANNNISQLNPILTGAASSISTENLTSSRALVSNASGKVAISNVTSAELGYLSGVTSNIQTQLNGKVDKITGKGLSDENYTLAEKNKLAGIAAATFEGTPNTLVLRNEYGAARFQSNETEGRALEAYTTGTSDNTNHPYAVYGHSSGAGGRGGYFYGQSDYGARIESNSGEGAVISSLSNVGASIYSASGTYHARFGIFGDNRSAVERIRGWFVWFFSTFTGRLKTADITANREWILPDESGTIALTSDNNYTEAEKNKLAGIAAGAEVNVNADWVATSGDAQILNKPTTLSGYGITDAVSLSGTQTITGTKTINAPLTIDKNFVTIQSDNTVPSYGLRIINTNSFDPGQPLTVDGRARVVHGMTFAAGITNFTNGSDHSHVQWTSQNRSSWQMIQNGGASNSNTNSFTLTTVGTSASTLFFNETNVHSVDTTGVIADTAAPFLATGIKVNYNTSVGGLAPNDFVQITFNPGAGGVVANTYSGIVTAGPTAVTIGGAQKYQYTFSLENFSSTNWVPASKAFELIYTNASGNKNVRVSYAPTQIDGTRVSLAGNYNGRGRYVLVTINNHTAFEGQSTVLSIVDTAKIGLPPASYNCFVKKVIDTNSFVISVGNAINGWASTSGTTGAAGWVLYKGSVDAIHQYTPALQHFFYQRFPTSDTTPTTTGGNRAIALGNSAEVDGDFSYSLGHKSGVFGAHSTALGGEDSFITGNYSTTVGGQGLTSSGNYQTIIGKFNAIDSSATKPLIVGWGTSDTNRLNLLELAPSALTVNTAISSTGAITGNSIVKAGGTSSQFLKADGSVDTNTYSLNTHGHSDATTSVSGFMSSADKIKLDGIALEQNTGRTIFVDNVTGNDTRGTLSKYSISTPFKTIGAAMAESVAGDLVWVRKGSYTITSTISLDGKGDIQCEAGTTISVGGNITAFSTNETKTVIGDVFVLANTAKLVAISGGTLRFEFASISSTSTGTLFTVTAGTIDTSFAYIVATSARAFELTGTGSMRIRRSHSVSCQQFLYANTTGGATIDLWTVVGNSPDTVFYIDRIVGLSYRGVNCNGSAGQNSYAGGYIGVGTANWNSNLAADNFILTPNSAQLNSTGGGFGYAINTTQAQITSPSRYSFSSKLKWNASRLGGTPWYGHAGLVLSNSNNLGGNYLVIGLQPVLDDTWARPFIDFKLGASSGGGIVYTDSTWSVLETTLDNGGAIRLQGESTPAVITVVKTSKESLRVVINSPRDDNRIITIKFTAQEAIDAFASFNGFGYAAYLSDWTFSDQVIEGNLAPTFFFNYPQSTAGGGPISEINPVLRNIRIAVSNPRTPATILTTNAQRYFYLDNVKIASWDNRLSIDSLAASTPVVAYDVYSNRPVGSNVAVTGDFRQISTIF